VGFGSSTARVFASCASLPPGAGAHGLYPSRDSRYLYVTNRAAGSISVVSFRTRHIVATWHIGGSPDMGKRLGRRQGALALGTLERLRSTPSTRRTANLLATIHVGRGPHGLCVWPQPGRYSLGHTGILR